MLFSPVNAWCFHITLMNIDFIHKVLALLNPVYSTLAHVVNAISIIELVWAWNPGYLTLRHLLDGNIPALWHLIMADQEDFGTFTTNSFVGVINFDLLFFFIHSKWFPTHNGPIIHITIGFFACDKCLYLDLVTVFTYNYIRHMPQMLWLILELYFWNNIFWQIWCSFRKSFIEFANTKIRFTRYSINYFCSILDRFFLFEILLSDLVFHNPRFMRIKRRIFITFLFAQYDIFISNLNTLDNILLGKNKATNY